MRRFGAKHVIGIDRYDLPQAAVLPFQDYRASTLVAHRRCKLQVQPAVEHEARDFIGVLVHEPPLPGTNVNDIDIVPSRVAVVQADRNEVRIVVMHAKEDRENVRRAINGMLLSLAMFILREASSLWIPTFGTTTTCASRMLCQTSARPSRPAPRFAF
jgi:hypothetical protein